MPSKQVVFLSGRCFLRQSLARTGDPLVYDDGQNISNSTDPGQQVGELAESIARLANRMLGRREGDMWHCLQVSKTSLLQTNPFAKSTGMQGGCKGTSSMLEILILNRAVWSKIRGVGTRSCCARLKTSSSNIPLRCRSW